MTLTIRKGLRKDMLSPLSKTRQSQSAKFSHARCKITSSLRCAPIIYLLLSLPTSDNKSQSFHDRNVQHSAKMDITDRDMEKAERDANLDRFTEQGIGDREAQRVPTSASNTSTGSSSSISVVREEIGMSRINTQRDLERHPTYLSRVETQRSQHSGTVGRSLMSRESRKPLPNFGGGRDYPPLLPDREEYVVEFDGPDDPLHPQNWSMTKK